MEILKGIGVSPGVAFGPVFIMGREEVVVRERKVPPGAVNDEIARFRSALEATVASYRQLREDTAKRFLPDYAAIFDAHIAILRDPALTRKVEEHIRTRRHVAEHAVSRVFRSYIARLEAIDEEYLSQRADDLRDIEKRLISNLSGIPLHREFEGVEGEFVLVTRFLSPTDAAMLPKDKVLAVATDKGGPTGHASMFARALGIPAVVGLKVVSHHVSSGDIIVVNGNLGEVIISPDEQTLAKCNLERRDDMFVSHIAYRFRHEDAVTKDGVRVVVRANVAKAEDVPVAVDLGAEGVGLFRTEGLFFDRSQPPTEEEQYSQYAQALDAAGDEVMTFRTFDVGSDKVPAELRSYFGNEANPALGLRAIRFAMRAPHLLRTQLKAMLRAVAEHARRRHTPYSNARIMFPMVTHPREFRWAKTQIAGVVEELRASGLEVPQGLAVGAMFEVPGIFFGARELLRETDFVSVGTNDLIQYLFAADRTNEDVADRFVPGHKALLEMLKILQQQILTLLPYVRPSLSVCGEMASDPLYFGMLLGAGITEFSVSFSMVPMIKHTARAVSAARCKELVRKAASGDDPELDLSALRDYITSSVHAHVYGGG